MLTKIIKILTKIRIYIIKLFVGNAMFIFNCEIEHEENMNKLILLKEKDIYYCSCNFHVEKNSLCEFIELTYPEKIIKRGKSK